MPARNERHLIETCMRSVDVAVQRTGLRGLIVVAADSCRDDTADVVRQLAGELSTAVMVIEGRWRMASRARAAAIQTALTALAGADLATVWIANTDADCEVPPTWLTDQLAAAATGADAVLGVVDLDPQTTPPDLLAEFRSTYELFGDTHEHAHAANFGVRADAYVSVGGWSRHAMVGEDHHLVARLNDAGRTLRYLTRISVTTSSRTTGRAPAGFANRLAHLAPNAIPSAR